MTLAAAARAAARRDRGAERRGGRGGGARATATSAGRPTGSELVADPRIGLFDNGGPNALHAEPTIAAAEAGKHVVCEKPLGRDADESYEIWRRVAATGVKHLCAFNYRFVPGGPPGPGADRGGRARRDPPLPRPLPPGLGRHRRATSGASTATPPAPARSATSRRTSSISRATSSARSTPSAASCARSSRRREVDDAVEATVEFENGAVGTLEATRLALGRRNAFQWEINGTKGSLAFDMERLNELQVFRADGDRARGFKTVLVSEADHPFWEHWWPPGHIIGWGDTFVHELHHLLAAIAGDTDVAPARRDVRGRLPRAPRSATRSFARRRAAGGKRSPTGDVPVTMSLDFPHPAY